jgi:hypothetical protein
VKASFVDNPFHVLGLPPTCTRADVESEGQKLLGMLALGLSAAKRYTTPLGPADRTEDKVRAAMAELRDPDKRLRHELVARLAPQPAEAAAPPDGGRLAPWPDALPALGWRRPR